MTGTINRIEAVLARLPESEREVAVNDLVRLVDELRTANEAACDEATAKGLTGRKAWKIFQRHFKAVFKAVPESNNKKKGKKQA